MRQYINAVQLNELNGYRSDPNFKEFMARSETERYNKISLLQGFLEHLEQQGYTALGSGAFAMVFTHPGINYAIKVFKNDSGYLNYLKYALANQDNVHVPRFRGKFMKVDDVHYVVRMELLSPFPGFTNDHIVQAIDDYLEKRDSSSAIFRKQPGLIGVLDDLIAIQNNRFDLHWDNIMHRADGTIVITDPFSW